MATLLEQFEVFRGGTSGINDLHKKVAAAVWIAAEAIRVENVATANHANRAKWARQAFQDPILKAKEMVPALIAANSGITQTGIVNANDTAMRMGANYGQRDSSESRNTDCLSGFHRFLSYYDQ